MPCAWAKPAFKQFERRVARINNYEPELKLESDDELRARMESLREQARNGAKLDDLLPETFAIVRETGKRHMGMRHFDVQMIGGMVLHSGAIAEMKTGEGKTLTATLPVVLNSLPGTGLHLVTVNDYLARRDAVDVADLPRARHEGRRPADTARATRTSTSPTPRTSRTARTPSSASTTCATTWRRR